MSTHITEQRNGKLISFSLGIISGISSFLFLTVLNSLIGQLLNDSYKEIGFIYMVLFAFVILLYVWSRRALSGNLIILSQTTFWKTRSEILKVLLKADYEFLRRHNNVIQSALTYDVNVVTQGALSSVQFFTSTVVVIACLVYMAIESLPLFFLTLVVAAAGVIVYLVSASKNNKQFSQSRELENTFMEYFNALIRGAKEIQIDRKKGEDVYNQKIIPIAVQSHENNSKAYIGFLNNQIVGQVMFYLLIASILVYFGVALAIEKTVIINFLFILLYLLGSLEAIMVLLPGIMQAKVSSDRIERLKKELSGGITLADEAGQTTPINFRRIEIVDMIYHYTGPKDVNTFQIGPINWQLKRGEIQFIYGGNGSGKTTFIHAVLGLLNTQQGILELNGEAVKAEHKHHYKQLFSVVFNDFYLFDEFYGNRDFDKERAKFYLQLFEIESKVEIIETGFSTVDLSTGQRKRLALIAAILENRPIIFLDEWAADQDPHFRKKFYTEILTLLKREGFTILAITHDDAYYHCCDKLYKMDYGKLYEETTH